ncbi:hypothetical protein GHU08_23830 [Citrobacter freundii]|uniref:hypothetical protein n=1 Tax=Citrobacter freundii TaxID=546 RepID=UPI0019069455|nr:hypothetical protein [Citrobacter freundii]MBJ9201381.1 hypothetical protein [Citrobacter freundii]
MTQTRRPSPLQRNILILLAGLAQRGTTRVRTRDLEQMLERGGDRPVYGNNLRGSCRRMESAGWLRTLRADNLQLAVELTDAGQALALPLLREEQARVLAEQRTTVVVVLPLVPFSPTQADGATTADRPVRLDTVWHMACRGDYVVRLDGTTCLQLWRTDGLVTRLEGDPLQVAEWLQACHDAGIDIRMQINESTAPEQGTPPLKGAEFPGGQASSTTVTWYQHLLRALRQYDVRGLSATNPDQLKTVKPGRHNRQQPLQERFLALAETVEGTPDALRSDRYEEDAGPLLTEMLDGFGFTPDQASRLIRLIRWPLMSQEEYDRRELNSLLDELERRQLYCNREQLTEIVFSPVRKPGESWTDRLQWLLMTDEFGFRSPLSHDACTRALAILAGCTGREVAEHLATVTVWNDGSAGTTA